MTHTPRYYAIRSVVRAVVTMIVMAATVGLFWALIVVASTF